MENLIYWEYEHDGELIQLQQLVDLVRETVLDRFARIELIMPFLPYGRQDKAIQNDQTFGLRSFARIINGMSFTRVQSYDAHSLVAGRLIERFHNVEVDLEIRYALEKVNAKTIVFPDKGAKDRYAGMFKPAEDGVTLYYAEKVRDQQTGHITHTAMVGLTEGLDVLDHRILVVDDICDGGRTFIQLANAIRPYCRQEPDLTLYVSHGIFSQGLEPLKAAGYQRIFTWKGEVK